MCAPVVATNAAQCCLCFRRAVSVAARMRGVQVSRRLQKIPEPGRIRSPAMLCLSCKGERSANLWKRRPLLPNIVYAEEPRITRQVRLP
jgi:hypothetical protein